jgi:hypothetical protein
LYFRLDPTTGFDVDVEGAFECDELKAFKVL